MDIELERENTEGKNNELQQQNDRRKKNETKEKSHN